MEGLVIRKANQSDKMEILRLSRQWEGEQIVYGYAPCTIELLNHYIVWCAIAADQVAGYLLGSLKTSNGMCVIPKDAIYFEVEELYVSPEHRNAGIGKTLLNQAEHAAKQEGASHILLSSAVKDFARIQRFYTQRAGFTVWTTTFFKEI